MVTDLRNSGITEGQGKSNIAPTFSKRGYKNLGVVSGGGGGGGVGGGVWVGLGGQSGCERRSEVFVKIQKKKLGGEGVGGGGGGGGVRVDVNEELKFL